MKTTYYVCPFCEKASLKMKLSEKKHIPTKHQKKYRPGMEHIATEILICPCGKKYTWFDLKEITA